MMNPALCRHLTLLARWHETMGPGMTKDAHMAAASALRAAVLTLVDRPAFSIQGSPKWRAATDGQKADYRRYRKQRFPVHEAARLAGIEL